MNTQVHESVQKHLNPKLIPLKIPYDLLRACRTGLYHVPRRSLGHVVKAGPASESVQKHPDHQKSNAQNTDLDALNPTILFIWPETAGKGKIPFGFHPTKLSVGPTTLSCGDHHSPLPPGGCGGILVVLLTCWIASCTLYMEVFRGLADVKLASTVARSFGAPLL